VIVATMLGDKARCRRRDAEIRRQDDEPAKGQRKRENTVALGVQHPDQVEGDQRREARRREVGGEG
jgi:hypothetical protein